MSERLKRLQEDLLAAETAKDHHLAKSIMELIEVEKQKESLRKWVWYR